MGIGDIGFKVPLPNAFEIASVSALTVGSIHLEQFGDLLDK